MIKRHIAINKNTNKPNLSSEPDEQCLASVDSVSKPINQNNILEQAYLQLVRNTDIWESSLDTFLFELCRSISVILDVGRVGVFQMNEEQNSLKTLNVYEAIKSDYKMPEGLLKSDFPKYFSALETHGIIDAHDAHNDPRTREFSEVYLAPLGVGAMLEVSLYKAGRLSGVICSEHLGGIRYWTESEKTFFKFNL